MTVDLDSKGIEEVLKSAGVRSVINDITEQVAGNVRAQVEADVEVDEYVTDRAAAAVVIKHPQALGMQARDGVLTRAAAAAGLEVKAKRG